MKYSCPLIIGMVWLGSLLWSGCDEDSFTQIVEIDLPEHTPMLSVNANYKVGSDSLIVKVGQTAATNAPNVEQQPQNVQIELYADGVLVPAVVTPAIHEQQSGCTYCPSDRHAVMHFAQPLQQGVAYELRVQASNLQTVSAVQISPPSTLISNIKYTPEAFISPDLYYYGNKLDEVTFDLTDAANEDNYYLFQMYRKWKDCSVSYYYCSSNPVYNMDSYQPNMEPIGGDVGLVTQDVIFDGKTRNVQLICGSLDTLNFEVYVVAGQITQDYYKYLVSLQKYYDTNDNFLAEPVNVFTNIENGVGCFAISHLDTFRIQ